MAVNAQNDLKREYRYVHLFLHSNKGFNLKLIRNLCDPENGFNVDEHLFVTPHKPLYEEDCRAWVHGPVYEPVYRMFKSFKFNPIDDSRFVLIKNRYKELTAEEKKIIELVVNTFGRYSGKVLENITHTEAPWIEARKNCLPGEHSNELISKASIKKYFDEVSKEYEMDTVEGIRKYISSKLGEEL